MSDTDIIISKKIYIVRGQKVMLDFDLAILYQTQTKVLNQSVKRNAGRFPEDFSFFLTLEEEQNLKSQFVTSSFKAKHGGKRKQIRVFTELGIAMLSSVLNTEIAIQVNIKIMRTFQKLREMLVSHKELQEKIEKLEEKYDGQFEMVFKALRHMLEESEKPKEKMGFSTE